MTGIHWKASLAALLACLILCCAAAWAEETPTPTAQSAFAQLPSSEEELAAFMRDMASRIGADTLLTPREVLRDFIGLLNVLRQNPGTSFSSLVKATAFAPADRDPEEDDFTEFTV